MQLQRNKDVMTHLRGRTVFMSNLALYLCTTTLQTCNCGAEKNKCLKYEFKRLQTFAHVTSTICSNSALYPCWSENLHKWKKESKKKYPMCKLEETEQKKWFLSRSISSATFVWASEEP